MTVLASSPVPCQGEDRALLLAEVDDWLDDAGRPIGEIRACAAVRHATHNRYARCPYPGSRGRQLRLINLSALEQTLAHWPGVAAIIDVARTASGLRPGERAPTLSLARAAAFVQILPAYLFFADASNRPVPAMFAAAHKAAAGLLGLCKNRLIAAAIAGAEPLAAVDTARSLHRYAEQNDALLSRTGIEACAGPPALVALALRILTGEARAGSDVVATVTERIGDLRQFARYADAVIGLHLWLGAFADEVAGSGDCHPVGCPDSADSQTLRVATALLSMEADARRRYADGSLALLDRLHPSMATIGAWRDARRCGCREHCRSLGAELFAALRRQACAQFVGPLAPLAPDARLIADWYGITLPR